MAQIEARADKGDRNAYRAASGLAAYDAAQWLEPPPSVTQNATLPSGLGVLAQRGSSASGRRQEVIVMPGPYQAVLVFEHSPKDFEWHVEKRKLRCDISGAAVATMNGAERSRWVSKPNESRAVHLHFSASWLRAALPDLKDLRFDNRFFAPGGSTRMLIQAFLADFGRAGTDNSMLIETYALLIARKCLSASAPVPLRGGLAPWQIRRVAELLRARLAEPISLAEIADAARLSPFHFARAFKASLGIAPHAYLQGLRIEHAKTLLVETDQPITQIAAAVGYETPQALARAFGRVTGLAPNRYRRERRS